jgi:hypothetical protein
MEGHRDGLLVCGLGWLAEDPENEQVAGIGLELEPNKHTADGQTEATWIAHAFGMLTSVKSNQQ